MSNLDQREAEAAAAGVTIYYQDDAVTLHGCTACAEIGRKGYCAPLRCYCDHDTCHAFASWTPLQPLNVTRIGKSTPARDSWGNREESTWIDKL